MGRAGGYFRDTVSRHRRQLTRGLVPLNCLFDCPAHHLSGRYAQLMRHALEFAVILRRHMHVKSKHRCHVLHMPMGRHTPQRTKVR